MHGGIHVERLEQRLSIDQLESEWQGLLTKSDVASPFLTPGWQSAWLDTYGNSHKPFVLVARRGDDLVGIWPLAQIRRGGFVVLEPIGAGRSDWLDVLTIPDERVAVLQEFVRYLQGCRRHWDLLDCRDILGESPTIAPLHATSSIYGLSVHREPRTVAPYLSLIGSWEQYLGTKRPKARSNLKYYRRRAERELGNFTISRHTWSNSGDVVSELADVEGKSWKALEGNLKISTPVGGEFYRQFCEYFAERGELDIWRADAAGVLIAFLVNIRFGGKCYHYNTCFAEEYGQLSPGLLLHADAIADAFERGLGEYDLLSGDEPYKERWANSKREIHHVAIHSSRAASRLAFFSLVGSRWAFRKSERLRRARQFLLSGLRRMRRRGEPG